MDNREIDITSQGEKHLAIALELFWANAPGGKATHYKAVRVENLVRYHASGLRGNMVHNCALDGTEFRVSHHIENKIVDGDPDRY